MRERHTLLRSRVILRPTELNRVRDNQLLDKHHDTPQIWFNSHRQFILEKGCFDAGFRLDTGSSYVGLTVAPVPASLVVTLRVVLKRDCFDL